MTVLLNVYRAVLSSIYTKTENELLISISVILALQGGGKKLYKRSNTMLYRSTFAHENRCIIYVDIGIFLSDPGSIGHLCEL